MTHVRQRLLIWAVLAVGGPVLAQDWPQFLGPDRNGRYTLVQDLQRVAEGLAPTEVSAEAPARSRPNARSGIDGRAPRHDAFWWWRFHQLALAGVYGAAFYGLWWVKQSSLAGSSAGSAATIGAAPTDRRS